MNITDFLFLALTVPLVCGNGLVPGSARVANGSVDTPVQPKRICETRKAAAVDNAKPSIYLSFERLDKIARYNGKLEDAVWLRLNNNTGWAVNIGTLGVSYAEHPQYTHLYLCGRKETAIGNGAQESPLYFLETKDGQRVNIYVHILTAADVWLASGTSLVFLVPQSELASNKRLNINYSYQWEWQWSTDRPTQKVGEPLHTVYFELEALPKSL